MFAFRLDFLSKRKFYARNVHVVPESLFEATTDAMHTISYMQYAQWWIPQAVRMNSKAHNKAAARPHLPNFYLQM